MNILRERNPEIAGICTSLFFSDITELIQLIKSCNSGQFAYDASLGLTITSLVLAILFI